MSVEILTYLLGAGAIAAPVVLYRSVRAPSKRYNARSWKPTASDK